MDLLFRYIQQKKPSKGNTIFNAKFDLHKSENHIQLHSTFDFEYSRITEKKRVVYDMIVQVNLENGDIETTYRFENHKVTDDKSYKSFERNKNNDFNELYELTNDGFMKGHRVKNFWGVKYEKAKCTLLKFVKNYLQVSESNNKIKEFESNELYVNLVNFHLLKNNIKGHDEVYTHIRTDYPKHKWLKKNNQKFIPAVLDGYGIKSNYLISEINQHRGLNIMTINYLCKFFITTPSTINSLSDFKTFMLNFFSSTKISFSISSIK